MNPDSGPWTLRAHASRSIMPLTASLYGAAMVLVLAAGPGAAGSPGSGDPAGGSVTARVVAAAIERTTRDVTYDGSYRKIDYPGGDVPDNVGVCTDLVVRAYRAAGVDLQVRVHEDMSRAFEDYPQVWGHERPDPNIDHRRVPNLRAFFRRAGAALPVTDDPADYHPGDLVTWTLPSGLPHIGVVVDRKSDDGNRPLIVHNIGRGPKLEDRLFEFPVTGHYRYLPAD